MFLHLNLKINKIAFFLNPTNPDEIIEITKKLKGSNSSGTDNISTKLLKSIINEIAPVLSHIFNRSLLIGIVPSQLKIAKVNPVFKSNDNQIFSNYRPISILPSISKILGFRPNRSTYTAINPRLTKGGCCNPRYGFSPVALKR